MTLKCDAYINLFAVYEMRTYFLEFSCNHLHVLNFNTDRQSK